MKIFVVNLAKNTERMAFVRGQLEAFGLPFERFEAIYGADLSKRERRRKARPFRFWCAMGHWPTRGAIGCALSHGAIYRKMIQENLPYACILEDDVRLSDKFPETLERVGRWLDPKRPQVVLFSAYDAERREGEEIVPLQGALCTDGYVITLPAARALLRANTPVVSFADGWSRWVRRGLVTLWRAYPTTVEQDRERLKVSDVATVIVPLAEMSPLRRVWHFVKRVIGVLIDGAFWVFARR